ncbi:MAG TPA: hypothetical protein VFT12_00055 [Thermoanaerobaculia bacterium]|nr:hypothetical protein [Thermoanaerobaculia bacterium]
MKRPGFLPSFFIILGVVFAAVVFVRIRSYRISDETVLRNPAGTVNSDADNRVQDGAFAQPDDAGSIAPEGTIAPERVPVRPDYDPLPLLDEPPMPTPVAQPLATAPPSLVSGVAGTSPPARAAPAPPAAAPARTTAAPSQPSQPAQSSASGGRSSDDRSDPPAEKDPTSDSTPPQLASISFTPPQVGDGEETMLVVQATDDLSGIRSISGTIIAPSGAVQGFATQRDADTNRYVARVIVPKDAAEGVWSVNYLNLMDNASNASALTAARGALPPSASFRVVSSRPDSQGPTLQAVWLDRRAMKGGEKNVVFVRASDDNSGVNLISGIFQSPSRQARVGFVCRGAGEGTWTCELSAPSCADCGEWQLEQVQLQDKANNMTTLRAPQSDLVAAVRVDISSELCDSTPPAVQTVALDRPVVSNMEQSTINITVTLTDDACGVLSVSGQATGPQTSGVPPRLYFSFTPAGDPQTWTGKLIVPRLAAKGIWRISFLQVLDRGQNLKTYTQNEPLLAGVNFVVD